MMTGLEFQTNDLDCTLPSYLHHKADAGTQWFFHNAPYTLLKKVAESVTNADYNTYTNQKIKSIIGMKGQWIFQGSNHVYWSAARDMARFRLLIAKQGKWKDVNVISDKNYFKQMTRSSQGLNPSYGYLLWLNGKNSIIFPSIPATFNLSLSPAASMDLIAGMGKTDNLWKKYPAKIW